MRKINRKFSVQWKIVQRIQIGVEMEQNHFYHDFNSNAIYWHFSAVYVCMECSFWNSIEIHTKSKLKLHESLFNWQIIKITFKLMVFHCTWQCMEFTRTPTFDDMKRLISWLCFRLACRYFELCVCVCVFALVYSTLCQSFNLLRQF